MTIQRTGAWLLDDLAPHTASALSAFREILNGDRPDWLKVVVARALWNLEREPEEVLPHLRAALKDDGNEPRVLACLTLAQMGEAGVSAIPDWEQACRRSLNTRRAALESINVISKGETSDVR